MKYQDAATKAIAISLLFYGLFLVLGGTLFLKDVINGIEKMKGTFYTQFPYYILIVVSSIGILKSKKWGIYLLFTILIFEIVYLVYLGYYQGMIDIVLSAKSNFGKLYGFAYIFCKKLLIPLFLIGYFLFPKVKKEFK